MAAPGGPGPQAVRRGQGSGVSAPSLIAWRFLAAAPPQAAKVLLYEDERRVTLAQVLPGLGGASEVWALVGPEGGFAPEEAARAVAAGFVSCRLPHTILRAETASLALAGVIRFAMQSAC